MHSDRRGTPSVEALDARPNNRVSFTDAQQIRAARLHLRYDGNGKQRHHIGGTALYSGTKVLALLGGIWRAGTYETLWFEDGINKALFIHTETGQVVVLSADTPVALPV